MSDAPANPTIFISHKTEDKELAVRILEFLRSSGYSNENLFLDSDPSAGLMVGQKWQEALYGKLQHCVCLIVLGTTNWATSKWCFAEAFIARNRDIPIIPLVFDEEADLSFLKEYQAVRKFTTEPEDLSRLLEILSQNQLAPPGEDEPHSDGWKRQNPELSKQQQNELLEQVSQQIKLFEPDRITRRLVVGISLFLIVGTIYIFFGAAIEEWWNPPEEWKGSTEEFIAIVKEEDRHKHNVILSKRVVSPLEGTGADDDSGYRVIALDSDVEVLIHSMANGELPAHSELRNKPRRVTGVVDDVTGSPGDWTVWMYDVELSVP